MFKFVPAGAGARVPGATFQFGPLAGRQPSRQLMLAMGVSVIFHLLLISTHFQWLGGITRQVDKPLEVILVNAKHATRPKDAQALAQTNLDGGGNTEENRRAATPLPPTQRDQKGAELMEAQRRVQELEVRQRNLITAARSKQSTSVERKGDDDPRPPQQQVSGVDMASSAQVMARMEAEISKRIEEYNKRPRKYHYSPRTAEYRFAQYVEDWRQRIERVGNLNYPEEARGKYYGSLLVTVTLRPNGDVDNIEVTRSSGQKVLDDAAKRIVRLSAPFPPFPPEMRSQVDLFVIPRVWVFTRSDELVSQQPQ